MSKLITFEAFPSVEQVAAEIHSTDNLAEFLNALAEEYAPHSNALELGDDDLTPVAIGFLEAVLKLAPPAEPKRKAKR